jgi:hypothetical protein
LWGSGRVDFAAGTEKEKLAMKHQRKKRKVKKTSARRKFAEPKNLEQYLALAERDQDLWTDVGQIVTKVKQGATFAGACREFGRNPRSVQRLAKPALRKRRNGRLAVKRTDRLLRVLQKLTPEGRQQIGVSDSRQASILGDYWNAVDRYRDTGDASVFKQFKGKHVIDADGKRVPLLTDLHEIDRQGSAGNLSFETIYSRVA